MQEQIGEAWGDRAALGRALDPRDQSSIRLLHRGLQPPLHIQHDPFLVGVMRDRLQHQLPWNGVKEGRMSRSTTQSFLKHRSRQTLTASTGERPGR